MVVCPLILLFTCWYREIWPVYVVFFYQGLVMGAQGLLAANMAILVFDPKKRSAYISTMRALSGVLGSTSPILAGLLMRRLDAAGFVVNNNVLIIAGNIYQAIDELWVLFGGDRSQSDIGIFILLPRHMLECDALKGTEACLGLQI